MIRVHIAHDNPLLRDTLAFAVTSQPDMEVVEATPEGNAGLDRVHDGWVDVLVLAVPPRESPFDEVVRYRRATPTIRIVGLYSTTKARNEMIAAGIDAVVDELSGVGPLLDAARRVIPLMD